MSETYVSINEYSRKCEPKGRTESEDLSKATWHCVRTLLCCFIIITLLALIAGLGGLGIGLYHFLTVSLSTPSHQMAPPVPLLVPLLVPLPHC